MNNCTVLGCHNASNNHSNITYHGFPSDPIVAAQWVDIVRLNRKEDCWKPTKYTKICSIHFKDTEKYVTKGGLCKIRQGAIPTKSLHSFCAEGKQNCNDNWHDPLELVKTQLEVSSADEASENASLLSPTTPKPSFQQQQTLNCNEEQASNEPIYQESGEEFHSVFDTPRKAELRRKLANKMMLRRKHVTKIKTLQQKARRLQKKNVLLQKILKKQLIRVMDNSGNKINVKKKV